MKFDKKGAEKLQQEGGDPELKIEYTYQYANQLGYNGKCNKNKFSCAYSHLKLCRFVSMISERTLTAAVRRSRMDSSSKLASPR